MKHNITLKKLIDANPLYFSIDTLKFFGEKLSNMYILRNTVIKKTYHDEEIECIVLSKLSINSNGDNFRNVDYFRLDNLKRAIVKEGE